MADFFAISLPVITLGFLIWFFVWNRRSRKPKAAKVDQRTRQERAVWAWANILSANRGQVNTLHMVRVELTLEIHLPGTPAYQGKTTWLVEEQALASVEEGREISVKVDPQDTQYIYPSGGWAKYVE
jgi:hypothetical protein